MFDLTGKVALVTGASRGIGRAIAIRLAGQGVSVIAAARGDHSAETVSQIISTGGRAFAVSVDVTDTAALEKLPAASAPASAAARLRRSTSTDSSSDRTAMSPVHAGALRFRRPGLAATISALRG